MCSMQAASLFDYPQRPDGNRHSWPQGEPLADFAPHELDEDGYTAASPEAQALTEQMLAEAQAAGVNTEALREDTARITEGLTDAEYHTALQERLVQAVGQARTDAARRDAAAARGSDPGDGQPAGAQGEEARALTLEAPTAEALQAAEDRAAAADHADSNDQARLKREADKARAAAELGDRTRQDASSDGFELGQSRAEVINTMAGNGDLFSQPDSADETPAVAPASPAQQRANAADRSFVEAERAAGREPDLSARNAVMERAAAATDRKTETQKNAEQRHDDARRIGREAGERGDPRDPPMAFTNSERQLWRAGWDASKATKNTPQVPTRPARSADTEGVIALRKRASVLKSLIDCLKA